MSIQIIGSNGSELTLITENKLDSIIEENEIAYNLYKEKYENDLKTYNEEKCNNNFENHLLIQLMKMFSEYDSNESFNNNFQKFEKVLDKMNNTSHILEYINIFFCQNKMFNKLDKSINKIYEKLNIKDVKLNNNYYLDLLSLQYLIKQNGKSKTELDILNDKINDLNMYLDKISILAIKKNTNIINNKNCKNKINYIITSLNVYLENIKFIKSNILKIDSLINIIIEQIYKFYNTV